MARKKHAEEHVNLERWLVSYADFITLLFATFVVLYALSQLDLAKFKDLKISLAKAFSSSPTILKGEPSVLDKQGDQVMSASGEANNQNIIPPILDQPYTQKEKADFEEVAKNLNDKKPNGLEGIKEIKAKVSERGLVINLIGNVIFEPASAAIKTDYYKVIDKLGEVIKTKFPNHLLRIEGHTDNLPMKSSLYPSNWELSSARASTIVRYLVDNSHIPANRFSAVGYAESRPVSLNDTEQGRKLNRRVEIVILKNSLLKNEILTEDFKKDLKNEVSKFKNAGQIQKKSEPAEPPQTSDAVRNLLKEDSLKGATSGNVIIFNSNKDNYQGESEKILNSIKQAEKQSEEDAVTKREAFYKGVRKSFSDKKE